MLCCTALFLVSAVQPALAGPNGAGKAKVAVCHHPPGDPGIATTIVIGAPAVAAHLAHGDTLGDCQPACRGDGDACDAASDCCSGLCADHGVCATPCGDDGANCSSAGDCCSGLCDDDGVCIAPCGETASACDGGADCCSDICTDTLQSCADQCTLGPELGGFPCSHDLDCCEGQGACIFGLCFAGFTCSLPDEACDLDAGQFCCFLDACIGVVCIAQ